MFRDINKWRKYFAEAVRIAQEQDYLSDMDYFDMGLEGQLDKAVDEHEQELIREEFDAEKRAMFRLLFLEDMYDEHGIFEKEEDEDG